MILASLQGDTISSSYDNLIGKIIAYGNDRKEAMSYMVRALNEIYIKGVDTNIPLLIDISKSEDFANGCYSNSFMSEHPELTTLCFDEEIKMMSVFGVLSSHFSSIRKKFTHLSAEYSMIDFMLQAKHESIPHTYHVSFMNGKHQCEVTLISAELNKFYVFLDGVFYNSIRIQTKVEQTDIYLIKLDLNTYRLRLDIRKSCVVIKVRSDFGLVRYCKMDISSHDSKDTDDFLSMKRAPFQCSFVKLFNLKIGDKVKQGDPILTISAMKMETVMKSPITGRIDYLIDYGDINRLKPWRDTRWIHLGKRH